LTLGPYYNVPAKTEIGQGFEIHYKYDAPVISLRSLKRAVEVRYFSLLAVHLRFRSSLQTFWFARSPTGETT